MHSEDWKFLEGVELKVAIAHGLVNANKIMKHGEKEERLHIISLK